MMTEDAFGDAGAELVIEEFMVGEEASFFALVDGENALPLVAAQDHKAVGDGDKVLTLEAWAPIRQRLWWTRPWQKLL